MQSYNARYASFIPKPRPKLSSKTSDLKWPHPPSFLATPTSLASAGFYFNPSVHTPDAVSCFICDKGLADWDPEDDPAEIHSQKCPKCPWAVLKCVTDINDNGRSGSISCRRSPRCLIPSLHTAVSRLLYLLVFRHHAPWRKRVLPLSVQMERNGGHMMVRIKVFPRKWCVHITHTLTHVSFTL